MSTLRPGAVESLGLGLLISEACVLLRCWALALFRCPHICCLLAVALLGTCIVQVSSYLLPACCCVARHLHCSGVLISEACVLLRCWALALFRCPHICCLRAVALHGTCIVQVSSYLLLACCCVAGHLHCSGVLISVACVQLRCTALALFRCVSAALPRLCRLVASRCSIGLLTLAHCCARHQANGPVSVIDLS